MIVDLSVAYGLMVFSQMKGPDIIEFLWGKAARDAALAIPEVMPDSEQLCGDYEDAHYDPVSDIFHTAGMIGVLAFATLALLQPRYSVYYLLSAPPVFYLPAWAGHFFLQKDIPAVFSYGTTLSGWANGEFCAYLAFFAGRTLQKASHWVPSFILAGLFVGYVMERTGATSSFFGGDDKKKGAAATKTKAM